MARVGCPSTTVVGPNAPLDSEGMKWRYRCDIDQIRGNTAFLSEYSDNAARLNSYLRRYEDRIAVLTGWMLNDEGTGHVRLAARAMRPHDPTVACHLYPKQTSSRS